MENRRSSRSQSGGKGPSGGGRPFPPHRSGGRDQRSEVPSSGWRSDSKRGFWKGEGDRNRTDRQEGKYPGKFGGRPRGPGRGQSPRSKSAPAAAPLGKITSDLQITDGRFHAKLLVNSLSPSAKPTPRKLREIVFKVISRRVKARRFLDLGCGCGTMGLEAISRGAMLVTLVEKSARIRSFLDKNVAEFGLKTGHAEVVESEIAPFLKQVERKRRRWDAVFLGSCSDDDTADILRFMQRGISIAPGGLFLIEHDGEKEMPEKLGSLKRWRVIRNEAGTITIFERP